MVEQMKSNTPGTALQSLYLEACGDRVAAFSDNDRTLLSDLLSDARTAYMQHLVLQARRRSVSTSKDEKAEA
jgi:hypothetical protein